MIRRMLQQPARLLIVLMVMVLLGGCLQQPLSDPNTVAPSPTPTKPTEALPMIAIRPVQLPKGYVAEGAVGDTLILRNIGQREVETLVLYQDGHLGAEIARRPWNTLADCASDGRWFVWCESKSEMEKKLSDPWTIWAWDSTSGDVRQIAQEAVKAEGDLKEIGPRIRLYDGRLIWPSVSPSPTAKVQLNLVELGTGERRVLAEFETPAPLRGYDIHGQRIAYGVGEQVVVITGTKTTTIPSEEEVGEVLVTADGVAWTGQRLIHWNDDQGTRTLSSGSVNRWWFSSADHYITWMEAPGNQLWLLHTPSGIAHSVIETGVINGGYLFGDYVAWTQYGDGQEIVGMVARLP